MGKVNSLSNKSTKVSISDQQVISPQREKRGRKPKQNNTSLETLEKVTEENTADKTHSQKQKRSNINQIRNRLKKVSALFFDDVLEKQSTSKYNLRSLAQRRITVPVPQSLSSITFYSSSQ